MSKSLRGERERERERERARVVKSEASTEENEMVSYVCSSSFLVRHFYLCFPKFQVGSCELQLGSWETCSFAQFCHKKKKKKDLVFETSFWVFLESMIRANLFTDTQQISDFYFLKLLRYNACFLIF